MELILNLKNLKDPNGAFAFNLGENSLFYNNKGEGRYYWADYDYKTLNSHHQGNVHEYLLCATPILADVFINIPKLKTHKKSWCDSKQKKSCRHQKTKSTGKTF